MWKERPRFGRLSVLAPAALSACIDASVLGAPAAGAIVATVLSELSKAFMLKKWYHGEMTKQQAEQLLMRRGRHGSYLVRESNSLPGEHVLSVRVRRRVYHVLIRKEQNKYGIGSGEHFDDLVGLIEHLKQNPMAGASGDELRLLQPVNASPSTNEDPGESSSQAPVVPGINDPSKQRKEELQFIMEKNMSFTTVVGRRAENHYKNRYQGIIPFDQTRVRLPGTVCRTDYINASYIRSSSLLLLELHCVTEDDTDREVPQMISRSISDEELIKIAAEKVLDNPTGVILPIQEFVPEKTYVATQGCTKRTVADFWHMICSERIKIIVTLTEVDEGDNRCTRYWPALGYIDTYCGVHVQTIREYARHYYIIREFQVRERDLCLTVHQYHYPSWPDHMTPPDTRSIITFMEEVNEHMMDLARYNHFAYQNIMCVHCSAGIGRTGTFIVIDMLMDIVRQEGLKYGVDIISTVQLVRAQRAGMVQNAAQFIYIYDVIRDYIEMQKNKCARQVLENISEDYAEDEEASGCVDVTEGPSGAGRASGGAEVPEGTKTSGGVKAEELADALQSLLTANAKDTKDEGAAGTEQVGALELFQTISVTPEYEI